MKITIKSIRPSPFQTRSAMNGQPLTDLQASMAEAGQAVPVKVRPANEQARRFMYQAENYGLEDVATQELEIDAKFELVYGHRRVEAAKQLKWSEIEAIVEELTDEQAMVQGLAENIQRDDLEPIDEARAFQRLMDDFGWTKRQIARRIGRSEAYVGKILKLLKLSLADQQLVSEPGSGPQGAEAGKVSKWHVDEVDKAALDDAKLSSQLLHKAADEGLTVAQTRKVAEAIKAAPNPKAQRALIDQEYSPFIHDADRIREQVRRTPGKDPVVQKRQPKKDQAWKDAPGVALMLKQLRQIEKEWAPGYVKLIDLGKLESVGFAFAAGKVRRAIRALESVIEKLED